MKASDIRDEDDTSNVLNDQFYIENTTTADYNLYFWYNVENIGWSTTMYHRNMSLWRRAVPSVALLLCVACQTIVSSALWNSSMLNLQDTLEGMEVTTEEAMVVQGWAPLFGGGLLICQKKSKERLRDSVL